MYVIDRQESSISTYHAERDRESGVNRLKLRQSSIERKQPGGCDIPVDTAIAADTAIIGEERCPSGFQDQDRSVDSGVATYQPDEGAWVGGDFFENHLDPLGIAQRHLVQYRSSDQFGLSYAEEFRPLWRRHRISPGRINFP